ncbi:MAG: diguanylate cyclase [Candidatus Angelobacter sp. Gp1-AA117]|nr:MAG: diguanylate cyclase [Candidatus Angelobacter sp. Gp1-AA117]
MSKHQELLQELLYFSQSARTVDALMEQIVERLHATMTRYNWVGFYLIDKSTRDVLLLGPHVGSFEPLERVPLDQGLCGAAASLETTVLVNNVAEDPRYLAGSEMVKSEIVVPVLVKRLVYGEIDINSYFANTFTGEDQELIEGCARLVGAYLENTPDHKPGK